MKTLIKWILFVPVCLLSVLLMFFASFAPETVTRLFATDINGVNEIIAFLVLGLFLVCFAVSFFERKLSPVYVLKKNFFAGITGLLAAFSLAASAALEVTDMVQTGEFGVLGIITAVFTALSGVSMLVVSMNHFSGVNTPKNISVLYLSLPLWCGVHLISRFMANTATPVAAADTMDLIMFVALAMFFIYAMMIHAVIPTKGTVKNAITFGFPTAVICLVFCVSEVFAIDITSSADYLEYIPAISYGMLGFYALSFTAELTSNAKTVDEQAVVDVHASDAEDTDYSDENYAEEPAEKNITTESEPSDYQENINVSQNFAAEADLSTEDYGFEEEQDFVPSRAASVRIADDDSQVTYTEPEGDIAQQLLSDAKRQDARADAESDHIITGSEVDMIIEGELDRASVSEEELVLGDMPKGPTSREAIMFDDDFILSVENKDDSSRRFDKSEDISAFILEKSIPEDDLNQDAARKKYDSRLDEIDQLIISIQGGDVDDQQ
ncbi:MAG: hypothetical protein IJC86_04150 [Clostridia bacterium]|nr:hypothetical protein [Clostridia bacterium]